MSIHPFTPVNRDIYEIVSNSYGCQNILLCEAMRAKSKKASKSFPHGFMSGDYIMSAYSDRMPHGTISSIIDEMRQKGRQHYGNGFESFAQGMSANQCITFAEKLTDGRCTFCGKRPEAKAEKAPTGAEDVAKALA